MITPRSIAIILLLATCGFADAATTEPATRAAPQPVAAIWYERSHPKTGETDARTLIVGVWSDGTVVWSDDRATGGKPYRVGRVDPRRIERLLSDLKPAGFFREKRTVNFGPDASYTVLAAQHGEDRQWIGSWHEPAREGGKSVVTERGIVSVQPGEKPPEPSPEYQQFLKTWSDARRLVEGVVPAQGELLEALDARVFELGRAPRKVGTTKPATSPAG